MNQIYGKPMAAKERKYARITLKVKDLVQAVNQTMNPGGEIYDWFAGYEDGKAAVEIRDGKAQIVNPDIFMGGTVDGQHVSNLKVVGYDGRDGGVYCEGSSTNAVIDHAYIFLEGRGKGLGGPDTGVSAREGATVTIKNAVIDSYGKSRFCTTAETGSRLYVYDSVLWSHGQPWGEGFEVLAEPMATAPAGLLIEGNSRAHCTMTNSWSYFYNSKIICDGWGALSTEGAEGFLYLEANDCEIIANRRGYGAYADPDCHVYFNRCHFDVADMSVILAGKSDAHFSECTCDNGTLFALIHNVNGKPEEVGELEVDHCKIHAKCEAMLCKSENTEIRLRRSEIVSDSRVLLRTVVNDDPCATKPSEDPYGIHVHFEEMKLDGDILHEDTERELFIDFRKTNLTGRIQGAHISMDEQSFWFADQNSDVILDGALSPEQLDAPEGVEIHMIGAKAEEYRLFSGGKLIVTDEERR